MDDHQTPERRNSTSRGERNSGTPRYPDVHVKLRSNNPYAVISAVRMALRSSQIDEAEILRFTEEALRSEEPGRMRRVCDDWARVEVS